MTIQVLFSCYFTNQSFWGLCVLLDFLGNAKKTLESLDKLSSEIDGVTHSLATYFNEDPSKFKLSDCLTVFSHLISKIEAARKEYALRTAQEERAAKLAAERAITAASEKENPKKKKESPKDDDVCLVDQLLSEIRKGEFKLKSRE